MYVKRLRWPAADERVLAESDRPQSKSPDKRVVRRRDVGEGDRARALGTNPEFRRRGLSGQNSAEFNRLVALEDAATDAQLVERHIH